MADRSDQSIKCAKCEIAMEAGYIQDIGYGITMQTQWLSGEPKARALLGMKNGIKYRMDGISLISYRCPKCALIEWYAPSKS